MHAIGWRAKSLHIRPHDEWAYIHKRYSKSIKYWEKVVWGSLIIIRFWETYEPLVTYWDRRFLALLTLVVNIRSYLKQKFWPQKQVHVKESNTMFFSNEDIYKEFVVDEHYVGLACNCLIPSFHMVIDCYKGYMVLVCAGHDEHLDWFGWWSIVVTQFCSNQPQFLSNWQQWPFP